MSEKYRTGISLPLDVWRIGRKDAVDDGLDFSAYVCQLIEREHARRQLPHDVDEFYPPTEEVSP